MVAYKVEEGETGCCHGSGWFKGLNHSILLKTNCAQEHMGNLYSELHQVLHNSLEVKGYEHYLPNFAKKALYFI